MSVYAAGPVAIPHHMLFQSPEMSGVWLHRFHGLSALLRPNRKGFQGSRLHVGIGTPPRARPPVSPYGYDIRNERQKDTDITNEGRIEDEQRNVNKRIITRSRTICTHIDVTNEQNNDKL